MSDPAHDSLAARTAAALSRTAGWAVPFEAGAYEGPRGAELGARVRELALLVEELEGESGQEGTGALLSARLGALVATRFVLGQEAEDRVRARELLDEARTSGLLGAEDRAVARRNLVALLLSRMVRLQAEAREAGMFAPGGLRLDVMQRLMEVGAPVTQGGSGMPEDTDLLIQLLVQEDSRGMAPEDREKFRSFAAVLEASRRNDLRGLVAAAEPVMRSGDEGVGLLGHLLNTLVPAALSLAQEVSHSAGTGKEPGQPADVADVSDVQRTLWEVMALAEASAPGTVEPGEMPKLISALTGSQGAEQDGAPLPSRMIAAMTHFSQAMRTGDLTGTEAALKLMHEAFTADEFDPVQLSGWLPSMVAGMLGVAAMTGGSLQDEELAAAILRDLDVAGAPSDSEAATLHVCARVISFQIRLAKARDDRDVDGVESVIVELQELDDTVSRAQTWVGVMVSYLLGTSSLILAVLNGEMAEARTAAHHFEQVMDQSVEFPALQGMLDASWVTSLTLTALLEKDPSRITEGVERARSALERPSVVFNFEAQVRGSIGFALRTLHDLTGDPAHLDEAVRELEQARAALPPDGAPGDERVHWTLAQTLATRAHTHPTTTEATADLHAALAAARASLRASADDVLLQLGVRHGLRMARQGADRGRTAALWALRTGDTEEAVACLEAGRSLVLQAAAVSSGVAERLDALGADELAERWRNAVPGGDVPSPRSPLDELLSGASGGGPALPGDVRRRSLALLRGRERPAEETASGTVAALRAGLARAGVDALVQLLPGSGAQDGALLLVTPDGPVRAVPSPGLSADGRSPVADYLRAGADRQELDAPGREASHQERQRADRAWASALAALCDWAGEVLTPVLGELGLWERALSESGVGRGSGGADLGRDSGDVNFGWSSGSSGPGRDAEGTALGRDAEGAGCGDAPSPPVRLVLVPCGDLGVVPWQAAVLRPPVEYGAPETVRACEVAVVSHAASGREFLRAAARERMRPGERPALVFHGYDLDWAEEEVEILGRAHYPGAESYAEYRGTAPTPRKVLALLGSRAEAPASLVHLACHGLAGPDPTTSALRLAPEPNSTAGDGSYAELTLSTLLDAPSDGDAFRARGPLVVCSACETDLATRDHDEALTVTSVLVHRLAADAIGSRWQVPDGGSEILMLVLHDRIAAGLAPPDALRAAQRWMLTPPDRRPRVAALDGISAYRLREDFRDRPEYWAAFVHQGNPAPAAPYETPREAPR